MSDDLRDRLERAPLPGAEDARRRAWTVVRGGAPPVRSRKVRPRAALLALLAAAAVTVAVTPPGAAVGEWVRDRVDPPPPAPEAAATPATRLPAPGRLLVHGPRGVAVVANDGTRTTLGRFDGATWSPHGLHVGAWQGTQLSALTPAGELRWRIAAPRRIVGARWSPDGYRVAYLTEDGRVRVVAGDGTGDRPFAAARAAIPAWRPSSPHVLALVSASGRIEVRDVDTGVLIARPRSPVPSGVRTLSWSPGGRLLAAMSAREIRVFDLRHRRSERMAPPPQSRFTVAAFAPDDATLAVVTRSRGRSTVTTAGRDVFATRGRIAGATWSLDGRWLMLDAPAGRQLIAVHVRGAPRVLSFPGGRVEGWSR
jgi:dipeptidyl aminopeptidase/acylaminoacyl peptidase